MKGFFFGVVGVFARGPSCPDCTFDVKALEEFIVNFDSVVMTHHGSRDNVSFTTGPSETLPEEQGTIAFHARNLQVKVDGSMDLPDPFVVGGLPLSGAHLHEELHINGKTGQASYHLDTPFLKMCGLIDGLPHVAEMKSQMINAKLEQAEMQGPFLAQQFGHKTSVDGEPAIGFGAPMLPFTLMFSEPGTHPLLAGGFFHRGSREVSQLHRAIHPPPSMQEINNYALKFSGYKNSVGDVFSTRACSIESQSASAALLASNPELKAFVHERFAESQHKVRSVLDSDSINTRFNFAPLDLNLTAIMFPEIPDALVGKAVVHPDGRNMLLMAGSFALGVAVTFVVIRRSEKKVALADQETA